MNRNALIHVFAALRFATGVAAWLVPNATGRLMGLSAGRDQPFTAQLFGSRELTLAVAITDAASPSLQTRRYSLACSPTSWTSSLPCAVYGPEPCRPRAPSSPEADAALFAGLGVAALNSREESATRSV